MALKQDGRGWSFSEAILSGVGSKGNQNGFILKMKPTMGFWGPYIGKRRKQFGIGLRRSFSCTSFPEKLRGDNSGAGVFLRTR